MSPELIEAEGRCEWSDSLKMAIDTVNGFAAEAVRLERDGVTREDVKRLAEAGVLCAGIGDRRTAPETRELHELLAAASGALWFVMAQHRSPADVALATDNLSLRSRYASGLVAGELLGAVSFAHLRRARPSVVAERDGDGWRVSGRLDWITSWGLADVLLLMAETSDGKVVQCLLPGHERPGLRITGELSLAAMQGTSTVGAVLEAMPVSDDQVARVLTKDDWVQSDAWRTANVPPAVVGLGRAALNELIAEAEVRGWTAALDIAARWSAQLAEERSRAYALVDDVAPAEQLDERLRLRASLTKLAQESTSLLVAVQGGRAMLTSSSAQRWAREAMFALVQAQTPATRNALLARYRRSVIS